MDINDLALRITELGSYDGFQLECQPIPGATSVLQVTVQDFDEIPAFVSITDTQILCITNLFVESEVNPATKGLMLEEMLELNIPMPLSSFSKLGNRYVIFGAMTVQSSIEDICREIITLTENAIEAIEALQEYLVEPAFAEGGVR